MKRTLFCLSIIIFVSALFFSCKRDYPKDIPQWLKEKIQVFKHKAEYDYYFCPTTITELKNNSGDCIYDIYVACPGHDFHTYYDLQGNEICSCQNCMFNGCFFNGQPITEVYKTNRSIWNCKTCMK
jgi:hypothetical protein